MVDPRCALTKLELFRAYRAVFASERASEAALRALTEDALTAAFRRQAFELHPDRAVLRGVGSELAAAQFRRLNDSHALLRSWLTRASELETDTPGDLCNPIVPGEGTEPTAFAQPDGPVVDAEEAAPSPPPVTNADFESSDRVRTRRERRAPVARVQERKLPSRALLFGQYLYYSGRASFRELAAAVAWQRAQRPRLGELAVRLGLVSSEDALRLPSEAAGRVAAREQSGSVAHLTPQQLRRVLTLQQRLQRPIGAWFIEQGLIRAYELRALLREHRLHNAAQARTG